jgi:hypothetical protein
MRYLTRLTEHVEKKIGVATGNGKPKEDGK